MSDRDAFREAESGGVVDLVGALRNAVEAARTRRLTEVGCVCCGTSDNLLWLKGDHELAVATICRPCKFGACEVCRGE